MEVTNYLKQIHSDVNIFLTLHPYFFTLMWSFILFVITLAKKIGRDKERERIMQLMEVVELDYQDARWLVGEVYGCNSREYEDICNE